MMYKSLLFNLADHQLIPEHKLFLKDRSELYTSLMIVGQKYVPIPTGQFDC